MSAMVAVMRGAGAAWIPDLRWSAACRRGACSTAGRRRAGTVGERRLEDALQFGGLIAGQLAAGYFAGNQVVDLRLQIAGREVVPLADALALPLCSEELMSVSAEDSAL